MYPACSAVSDWMFPPAQTLGTAVTKHKDRKISRIRRILYLPNYHNNISSSPIFQTSSFKTGIRSLLNRPKTLRIDRLPTLKQTNTLKRYLYLPPWASSVMSCLAKTARVHPGDSGTVTVWPNGDQISVDSIDPHIPKRQ